MRLLFCMIISSFVLFSCGTGTSNQNNNSSTRNNIYFLMGDENWSAQGYGQYAEVDGKKIISILGTNTEKGMNQFGIKIHNFNGTGGYRVLSGDNGSFVLTFSSMNKETGQTKYYQVIEEQAEVSVTAYDANQSTISGEFEFKVKDQDNNIVDIKNGHFTNLKLVDVQ